MIPKKILVKYKNIRKKYLLSQLGKIKRKYAFIGVGPHSLDNLYPVIDYLQIPLKYIYSKHPEHIKPFSEKYNALSEDNMLRIFEDKEVFGVFISFQPDFHYTIALEALEAGKHVFVEKPPCRNLNELIILLTKASTNNLVFSVGFQRRYAPCYTKLKTYVNEALFYDYKYCAGRYPEGDAILELFIHPLNILTWLFGEVISFELKNPCKKTYLLLTTHKSGICGTITLSCSCSWEWANETLQVTCKKGTYVLNFPDHLYYTPTPPDIAGIPLEKIISNSHVTKHLFRANSFIPVGRNNQIYTSGYYSEIEKFCMRAENHKTRTDHDDYTGTYRWMTAISEKLKNGVRFD